MIFRTVTIGRGSYADIRLDDTSISRLHAELTLTRSGRYYLTDRNSLYGTHVLRNGNWVAHRQGYVGFGTRLMFGNCEVVLSEILKKRSFSEPAPKRFGNSSLVNPRRNVKTGEIEF